MNKTEEYILKSIAIAGLMAANDKDAAEFVRQIPCENVRPVTPCRDCNRYDSGLGMCKRTRMDTPEDGFCNFGSVEASSK